MQICINHDNIKTCEWPEHMYSTQRNTFPTTGISIVPHVSAAQWTRPDKKSATTGPSTGKIISNKETEIMIDKDTKIL